MTSENSSDAGYAEYNARYQGGPPETPEPYEPLGLREQDPSREELEHPATVFVWPDDRPGYGERGDVGQGATHEHNTVGVSGREADGPYVAMTRGQESASNYIQHEDREAGDEGDWEMPRGLTEGLDYEPGDLDEIREEMNSREYPEAGQ